MHGGRIQQQGDRDVEAWGGETVRFCPLIFCVTNPVDSLTGKYPNPFDEEEQEKHGRIWKEDKIDVILSYEREKNATYANCVLPADAELFCGSESSKNHPFER